MLKTNVDVYANKKTCKKLIKDPVAYANIQIVQTVLK